MSAQHTGVQSPPPIMGGGVGASGPWAVTPRRGHALAFASRADVPTDVAARAQARAAKFGHPAVLTYEDGAWWSLPIDLAQAGDVFVNADGWQSLVGDTGEVLTWETVPAPDTAPRCPHGFASWCDECPPPMSAVLDGEAVLPGDRVKFRAHIPMDPRGNGEYPPTGEVMGYTLDGSVVVDVGFATLTASIGLLARNDD